MPTRSNVENQISNYINENLPNCLKEIKSDFSVSYSSVNTKTTLSNEKADILINMPITVSKDKSTMKIDLKDVPVEKRTKLFEILEVAKYITDSHKEEPDYLCLSCISEMAEERNLYINTFTLKDNDVLILIYENSTSDKPYYFEFLNKYPVKEDNGGLDIPELPKAASV